MGGRPKAIQKRDPRCGGSQEKAKRLSREKTLRAGEGRWSGDRGNVDSKKEARSGARKGAGQNH